MTVLKRIDGVNNGLQVPHLSARETQLASSQETVAVLAEASSGDGRTQTLQTYPAQVQILEGTETQGTYKQNLGPFIHDFRNSLSVLYNNILLSIAESEKFKEKLDEVFPRGSFSEEYGRFANQTLQDWETQADGKTVQGEFDDLAEKLLLVCKDLKDEPECTALCKSIKDKTRAVLGMICDFNDSKGDLNHTSFRADIKPDELVRAAVSAMKNHWTGNQLDITGPEQTGLVDCVSINPHVLRSCIENLIINAAKAAQKLKDGGLDTKCSVSLSQEGDRVKIVIRDEGPGMPEELIEKVLSGERCSTSLGAAKGTEGDGGGKNQGLGLFNIRTAITAAGGELKISSSRGADHHTCFTIELPSVKAREPEASADELKPAQVSEINPVGEKVPSPSGPFKILVIDDRSDSAKSLVMVGKICLPDCIFEIANSVEGAMTQILNSTSPPHLILADVNLGAGLPGPKIKEELGKHGYKGSVVIALSGEHPDDVKQTYKDLDGALHKPVDPIDLFTNLIPKEKERFFQAVSK